MFLKDLQRKRSRKQREPPCACRATFSQVYRHVQHVRSHITGACWDTFRLVDLSDNHRATLINTGLQFLPASLCARCKSLYLKAGLFTFLHDGGWKILPVLCASEKQILSFSNITSLEHYRTGESELYLHVAECEP